MAEIELNKQIAALPEHLSDRLLQKQRYRTRKYMDQLKADRLLSLVTLPGYFPYRGYLTCDSKLKSLLHTGLYIKYPKSSNRQKRLKRQAAKKVRNNPISGKGNHYRRVFDYRWELD